MSVVYYMHTKSKVIHSIIYMVIAFIKSRTIRSQLSQVTQGSGG